MPFETDLSTAIAKKKSPQSAKDIQPYFDYNQIGTWAMIGAAVFGGAIVANQIKTNYTMKKKNLDPPAPNMKQLAPDCHELFYELIAKYFHFIPEHFRENYKEIIRRSIWFVECFFCIENQLLCKEISPDYTHYWESRLLAIETMNNLKKSLGCFTTEIIEEASETLDCISFLIANHINNIFILCDNV